MDNSSSHRCICLPPYSTRPITQGALMSLYARDRLVHVDQYVCLFFYSQRVAFKQVPATLLTSLGQKFDVHARPV